MKSKFKNMDKFLLLMIFIYTVLGLVMVFSASSMTAVLQYKNSESFFFINQLKYIILGYIVGIVIIFMPYKWVRAAKKTYKLLAYAAMGVLFLTITCGKNINGVTSWLSIGGKTFQPSEFVKTMTILFLAFSFNNPKKIFKGYKYLIPFVYAVICVGLIAAQPDFGTAMILGIICFLLFLGIPLKDKHFSKLKVLAGAIVVVGACMFFFGEEILSNFNVLNLNNEQLSRLTYTNPCTRYSEKTGYQVCNGYIAINNGGLFGVGLGNSKQKYLYLPEAYTDFVFPIIVEELGSVAASLIIIGFLVILYRLLRIARISESLTGSMLAYGTFAYILAHLLINLLGVLAIIPLTGVPLPFLSYGGSFNLNLIVLLFISERVAIESKNRKLKREIESL